MLSFGLPLLLLLLLLVPALAVCTVWAVRQRRLATARFAGSRSSLAGGSSVRGRRRALKAGLFIAGVGLVVLGAARPQHGAHQIVVPRTGSDVVLAIDVSRSMNVQDVSPSRLDRAKQAADALMNHLNGDRVGLVVFAGSAVVRFPLTTDTVAAQQVVDSLAILDSGVKSGTDLDSALAASQGVFSGSATQGKVVVIISDGEDLAGQDFQAAQSAASSGLTIETIGVGTVAGGPVFAVNNVSGATTPVVDPDTGQTAISHRDDGNLLQLAVAGHGTAYDGNSTDFAFALSNSIDRLQPTTFQSGLTSIPVEYFQLPLILALLLLFTDMLLPENLRPRSASARVTPPAAAPAAAVDDSSAPPAAAAAAAYRG